jgi:hypothetical protein
MASTNFFGDLYHLNAEEEPENPTGQRMPIHQMVEHGGHGGKLLKAIAVYTTDHGRKRWMGPDAATSKPRSPSSGLASANADAPEGAKDSLGIAAIALLVAHLAPRFAFRAASALKTSAQRLWYRGTRRIYQRCAP